MDEVLMGKTKRKTAIEVANEIELEIARRFNLRKNELLQSQSNSRNSVKLLALEKALSIQEPVYWERIEIKRLSEAIIEAAKIFEDYLGGNK